MERRIVVAEAGEFAITVAGRIAGALKRHVAEQDSCALVLTGGRTAGPVYERLAGVPDVPWNRITFFFGDERGVPPDHPDSNYRLARETLLSRIPIADGQVHRMPAERADRNQAAREYEQVLPPAPELLLLGVGPDGHIASIFPGSDTVGERVRRVLPARGGEPDLPRLTITPRVLTESREILVFAEGEPKHRAITRALRGSFDPTSCPAQLVREAAWVLDRAAAGPGWAP